MDFLTKLNVKWSVVLKIIGLALLAIIVVAIGFRLLGSSFNSVVRKDATGSIAFQGAAENYASDSIAAVKYESAGSAPVSLSIRNISPTPQAAPAYQEKGTTGSSAEEFEITEYGLTIQTRQLEKTCLAINGLKERADVIFENANEYDYGCDYYFKVKRDKAPEILARLKEFKPKDLSESIYTIKNSVDDFTSEVEILKKKLTSIDETLGKAIAAYDDVTVLATKVQNVESLAKIIDSKINIIERLTQERININSELERIERAKAQQLDRLEYTYFRVNVFENKFIDGENLKDSWVAAIKGFVRDINAVAQDITINLVAFLFLALQYIIYFFILLVIAKYGWQLIKYIWKK